MTNNRTHTPSPWHLETVKKDGKRYTRIADSEDFTITTFSRRMVDPFDNAAADANLIANAPDMLKMLEKLWNTSREGVSSELQWQEVYGLICKAKGETPL